MDFIAGGDLFFHMKRNRMGFPKGVARFFIAEIIVALEFLHKNNIVYRDLKPENILLDGEGHLCLTDFGLSKILGDQMTTKTIAGTLLYMAPEVLRGERYGTEADWWSVGVILFILLTGRHPFYAPDKYEVADKILTQPISIFPYEGCPSKKGFDLIARFLKRIPKERLIDMAAIKAHPFFKGVEWEKLSVKNVKPPLKFKVKGEMDLSFFEQDNLQRPVVSTAVNPNALDPLQPPPKENADQFGDFTYVNQSLI